MDFKKFTEEVRDKIRDICGPDFSVTLKESLKNNSVRLTGIVIMKRDSRVAPAIYLEEFYTDFCDGKDMDDIVNAILRVYSQNKECGDVDIRLFENFEKIRPMIIYKLINYEKNLDLLRKAPHRRFLDLAVIYVVSLGQTSLGNATVTVYNEHMENWGITEEELWELSNVNTPKIAKAQIVSLYDMVCEMTGGDENCLPPEDNVMYVLTNSKRINGAACMLYDDVISGFAQKLGKDLYIIPSSVHEVILMPADGFSDTERIIDIINEVNSTQVAREEILSYKLYKYSRSAGRISCM